MSEIYSDALPEPRPVRVNWMRFIVDYNPCFLLSAVCMLLGCRLLNDAINLRTGDVRGALWLIMTINVYEFALIGVATLIRRVQGMRRDVGILLVVAVLFLCDIVFVAGDLSTTRPGVGLIVTVLLTALAAVKADIALRLLNSPKRLRTVAIVAGQVAMLLLLPIVLKQISAARNGNLPPLAIYAGWWIAGLLPVIARLVLGYRSVQKLPALAKMYVIIPYAAFMGHLLACTWVFKLPFYVACYSPVMIGLAIVVGLSRHSLGRVLAANLQWFLAAVAVLLAMGAPSVLSIGSHHHWATLSALRITLIAAGVVNVYGLITMRHALFAVTVGAMGLAAILGPTVQLMVENVGMLFAMSLATARRLVPRSTGEWGVATIGLAFMLLLLGAFVSVRVKPVQQKELLNS